MRREVLGRESYYLDLDVVDPTAPSSAHSKASRRRRVTNKPSSEDSIRCYLHEIGEVKLLGARAEVHLARDIAKLLELERISMTYKDSTGREPTIPEWANQAGMDVEAFRDTLRRGLRAKERMVAANLRLVVSIAKKYLNRGLTFQDLIQEGSIGLIRGAEKFDADKGFKFSTYATWWIRQAITRAIADHSRPIRLPVHVNDTIAAIKKTSKILHEELNRTPTEIEIGERMNISVEKLRFLNGSSRATISLETPISRDSDSTATLGSFIVYPGDTPEETAMQNLLREDLENVLNTLTPRERDVVRMRYGFDDGRTKTLEEIGSLFSVTRERIRQIESKALRKLRHPNRNAVLREWVYDS
jgi:RNA polymerase primary sigma factor